MTARMDDGGSKSKDRQQRMRSRFQRSRTMIFFAIAAAIAVLIIVAVLISPSISPLASIHDSDGDGYADSKDAFPQDPDEWVDSDGDGVGDNSDQFIDDPNEWADSDGDDVGDNKDDFPNDPTRWLDTDDDGYADFEDEFPNDPSEWKDSDGDGYGDNFDAFPDDSSRWVEIRFALAKDSNSTHWSVFVTSINGVEHPLKTDLFLTVLKADLQVGLNNTRLDTFSPGQYLQGVCFIDLRLEETLDTSDRFSIEKSIYSVGFELQIRNESGDLWGNFKSVE